MKRKKEAYFGATLFGTAAGLFTKMEQEGSESGTEVPYEEGWMLNLGHA